MIHYLICYYIDQGNFIVIRKDLLFFLLKNLLVILQYNHNSFLLIEESCDSSIEYPIEGSSFIVGIFLCVCEIFHYLTCIGIT